MRDFFPEQMRHRNWLFATWRRVAQRFGYEEYEACVLESEELFTRKAGDDIVAQLYGFSDKGERRVALRPEVTPSLARMVLSRGRSQSLPLRWFSIPQCFRYERMQKGRKREHFQWNMDVIGLASMAAEVELMSAQVDFLREVGFRVDGEQPDIVFKLSNRQVLEHALKELGISGEFFAAACVIIDKRDKIGDDKVLELLNEAGIDSGQGQQILELLEIRGLDALRERVGDTNPGYRELASLMDYAQGAGIAPILHIDLSVVRGLSYYTGTVWELFDTVGGGARAIAGGGRYDKLMETFGGDSVPMVGFGFGDVGIGLLLEERGLWPAAQTRIDDVIYPMQESAFGVANKIAASLRRTNRRVWIDYSLRRFKNVIKAAEALGSSTLYILGEQELAQNQVKVRSLGKERLEELKSLSDFS
jgi:histidyl-tRNA synthetase